MKSIFVNDLEPNQDVTSVFLVQAKTIRQKKSGEPYLSLTLVDKTGSIEAKMWDNVSEVMDTFERDDFIKTKGRVQVYQNKPQFTIHKLLRTDPSEVQLADFFPASARSHDEMMAELRGIVGTVENQHLSALLHAVFDDPEIAARYQRAPAAKSVHHAYLGGLIEHVLSVAKLAEAAAAHYPFIDRDLLLTGVFLHDIGKIYELAYERSFSYTDEGQLLGHIVIGVRMIGEKLAGLPDFPPELRTLVEHMVLSHHGELEFGSPKLPVFAEAVLLHFLDNIDSKMENIRAAIAHDKQVDGFWTAYDPPLERFLLKKDKYLGIGDEVRPPKQDAGRRPEAARSGQPSLFSEKLSSALLHKDS